MSRFSIVEQFNSIFTENLVVFVNSVIEIQKNVDMGDVVEHVVISSRAGALHWFRVMPCFLDCNGRIPTTGEAFDD